MKIIKETAYLDFADVEVKNRKTKIVAVINKHHQEIIGEIRWFGKWRQYCFYPYNETVWNIGCLEAIQEAIGDLTRERFAEKDRKEAVTNQ
jgi:hypothetical protein